MYIQPGDKINLTFSRMCFARLSSDMHIFEISLSKAIERIVCSFCRETAGFSLDTSLQAEKLLIKPDLNFPRSTAILLLTPDHASSGYTKNTHNYNWSVTKSAIDALNENVLTKNQSGSFIHLLLEEYVTLPFGKREKIMLYDKIKLLQSIMETNCPFEYLSGGPRPRVMHPYKLMTDPDLQYNYLVGHTVSKEEYNPETFIPTETNVGTIRLLNLKTESIRRLSSHKKKISEPLILDKIAKGGISFLSNDIIEIRVLLNKSGEQLFRSIIHNRPMFVSRESGYTNGWREYVFHCNIFRATIYFSAFRRNAKIISPPEAVEDIKNYLSDAYHMYK